MKKKGPIEVTLKKDYRFSPDLAPRKKLTKKLTAGTPIDVHWVSIKRGLEGHKGHTVQFTSKDKGHDWVEVTWNEVNHPQECILSQTPYADDSRMMTIYCATYNDFVGVEPDRTEDIDYCPICGKKL